jgi:eukaryotic-like serine/threonine-protein kinase
MKTTLSSTQWQHLQSLFDRAEQMDNGAANALIASLRQDDTLIAETLAAMLSAHRQWQQRTGSAIEALAAAVSPSAVGARLGAFTLVKEIGRGGMGTVYLGERADGQVQQQVAIKVLHARNLDDNTRARFQREREILAGFDHPGIARLLDVGESEAGEPYYVMEYLRGLPIDAHCDQNRLGIRERLHLFRSICDAVQYAHGKLILHRDIKPSNIIVDAAGVPKLIDFGIAKPIHLLDAAKAEETAAHQRYFSPVNAAPEQIRGESVSVACDVYQLGTLLHELLCGRPIFEWKGSSVSDLEHKISAITPDAPSAVAASATDSVIQARAASNKHALARAISGDLDAIVQRAVRKEPQLRYASVEQLSQDIERHLQDRPVHGRRGNHAYRLSRFVKRNWRAIVLTGIAVAAFGSFTSLLYDQVQQTTLERDRAVAERRRAESVTEFLIDTFRSGDPAVAKKSEVSIGEALDHSVRLLENRLVAEPLLRAQISRALSEIYTSLEELELAEKLSVQALSLLDSMPNVPGEVLIAQLRTSATTLLDRLKYAEADAALLRLRKLESGQNDISKTWRSRLIEIRAFAHVDERAACEQAHQLAATLRKTSASDVLPFARAMLRAASCSTSKKQALQDVDGVRHAIALVEHQMGKDDTILLALKSALGGRLRNIGQQAEMKQIFSDLLADNIRIYGADSISAAKTLLGIGMSQLVDGEATSAVQSFQRAYDIYSAVHGESAHGDIAAAAYNLGLAYDFGKIDAGKALEWYEKAFDVGVAAFGPNSYSVGAFATEYGTMLWRSGDLAKAEPVLRTAYALTTVDSPGGIRARLSLAQVLAAKGRWSEVASIIAECESGGREILKDPDFAVELEALRSRLSSATR